MRVLELKENRIRDIGHAFGYYDYGTEHGLIDAFPSRDAVSSFICGYVRMALKSGMLYAASENGEGYIAYKLPGQKVGLTAALPLAKGLLSPMTPKELLRFAKIMSKGGCGLDKQFDKAKKPRRLGLRSGVVSRARVHAQGQGSGVCGRRSTRCPGDPGHRRQVQVRQVYASRYGACRHAPLRRVRRAV